MSDDRKLYLIGNAHLDPVWLWRWQEGYAEVKATFRSALDRMKEYPEFIFTCAGTAYYKWVEENAPEMFEEIKERVKEGRWVIAGGWWIQPDCNIPSGEAFVRQGLYGQRYFKEKFGVMARVGYNVDSFGHNGMLPQILKKSGMDYYVFMRPGEQEKALPYNLFWWESQDGSRIMAYKLPFGYSHGYEGYEGDMKELAEEQNKFHSTLFLEKKFAGILRLSKQRGVDLMGFYGVGNHGGGPTIKNLELIRKLQAEWGEERIFHSSPNEYFDRMSAENPELPIIKDDLQHHAVGCYSAHSEIKETNRRAEHSIITAEKFAVLANILMELPYPGQQIRKAWQNIMFNQFHDIMGGCSIKEAYQDARESYGEALHISAELLNASLQRISWAIDTMGDAHIPLVKEKDWRIWETEERGVPLVVFNPLSWPVKAPIQINKAIAGITDEAGNACHLQAVRGAQINFSDKWDTLFIGSIPALGYRVFRIYTDKKFEPDTPSGSLRAEITKLKKVSGGPEAETVRMENEFIRLEFEAHTGYIKRLFDKRVQVEVLSGPGAVPVVIDESDCDTWAHGITEFRKETGSFTDAEFRLLEKGPLRSRLRVISRYNNSLLQQDFMMYHDRPDIEVRVKLDWREKHKLLKLSFPAGVLKPSAAYEIPYGFINRAVNGEEEPGQQWADISGTSAGDVRIPYGLSVINNAKYGYDMKDNDLRITVVRSPIYADHFGERDEFCEFMDQGIQEFKYVLIPHAGTWTENHIVRKAYELNTPPVQVIETYHRGSMPLEYEGIKISEDNIIAAVLKEAEEGEGYILRCYETGKAAVEARIELTVLGRSWETRFGICEIKTFWIPRDNKLPVVEKNLVEM